LITVSYNGNHVLQKVILSKREFCPYLSDRSEKDSENNYQLNKRNQAKIVVQTHKKTSNPLNPDSDNCRNINIRTVVFLSFNFKMKRAKIHNRKLLCEN
jgi:hypothetical protein